MLMVGEPKRMVVAGDARDADDVDDVDELSRGWRGGGTGA